MFKSSYTPTISGERRVGNNAGENVLCTNILHIMQLYYLNNPAKNIFITEGMNIPLKEWSENVYKQKLKFYST